MTIIQINSTEWIIERGAGGERNLDLYLILATFFSSTRHKSVTKFTMFKSEKQIEMLLMQLLFFHQRDKIIIL